MSGKLFFLQNEQSSGSLVRLHFQNDIRAKISARGTLNGADVCTFSSQHEGYGSTYVDFFIPLKDSTAWSLHVSGVLLTVCFVLRAQN